MNSIEKELQYFVPTTLAELQKNNLPKRFETKFICSKDLLPKLLHTIADSYKVLDINNKRIQNCCNAYYDTEEMHIYNDHILNKPNRYKIRSRCYKSTEQKFLDIKFRSEYSHTIKSRLPRHCSEMNLTLEDETFISQHSSFNPNNLDTKLVSSFERITLHDENEIFTIDMNINFLSHDKTQESSAESLIIIEVKQAQHNTSSAIMQALKKFNIQSIHFSKYCFGIASLKNRVEKEYPKGKKVLEYIYC